MRKYVHVKTQRKLMFIPFINLSIIIISMYNCWLFNVPKSATVKSVFITFFRILVISVFQMLLYKAFGIDSNTIVGEVLSYIFAYLFLFSIAYSEVRFQEKFGLE